MNLDQCNAIKKQWKDKGYEVEFGKNWFGLGRDLKGKMVTSGIYMVETATSDGSKGTVCKIAIIR